MQKLYFGHPVNTYNTALEQKLLTAIARGFPTWLIENPNTPEHDEAYKRAAASGSGMTYFFDKVLPACEGGVFLPFRDGKWGKGVYAEAEALYRRGCPVWEIEHATGFCIRLPSLPPASLVLTVEETRARIRNPDRTPVPY